MASARSSTAPGPEDPFDPDPDIRRLFEVLHVRDLHGPDVTEIIRSGGLDPEQTRFPIRFEAGRSLRIEATDEGIRLVWVHPSTGRERRSRFFEWKDVLGAAALYGVEVITVHLRFRVQKQPRKRHSVITLAVMVPKEAADRLLAVVHLGMRKYERDLAAEGAGTFRCQIEKGREPWGAALTFFVIPFGVFAAVSFMGARPSSAGRAVLVILSRLRALPHGYRELFLVALLFLFVTLGTFVGGFWLAAVVAWLQGRRLQRVEALRLTDDGLEVRFRDQGVRRIPYASIARITREGLMGDTTNPFVLWDATGRVLLRIEPVFEHMGLFWRLLAFRLRMARGRFDIPVEDRRRWMNASRFVIWAIIVPAILAAFFYLLYYVNHLSFG